MRNKIALAGVALTVWSCGGGDPEGSVSGGGSAEGGEAPAESAVVEAQGGRTRAWDPAQGTARVRGVVRFGGEPPRRRKVDMGSDPQCHEAHPEELRDESVIVGPDGTLGNVFVWIKKGLGEWEFPTPTDPVVLDQVGCMYRPHVVGLRTGQTLVVRNGDPVVHNIHSYARKNPSFNRSQPTGGDPVERVFSRQEVLFTVKCDLHGWMSSYVGVVDHPYFAVTGDDGSFDLSGLPPGDFTIVAVHEVFGTKKTELTVGDGETREIEFTFTDSEG